MLAIKREKCEQALERWPFLLQKIINRMEKKL